MLEIYRAASQQKLRIQTKRGLLSVEQLWDLPLDELDALAVSLEQEHKESGKKSFLAKKSEKDKIAKLKFDIVLDVLTTKVEEAQAASDAKDKKEHNEKILRLIMEKKDEALKGKSIKQLEEMLQ